MRSPSLLPLEICLQILQLLTGIEKWRLACCSREWLQFLVSHSQLPTVVRGLHRLFRRQRRLTVDVIAEVAKERARVDAMFNIVWPKRDAQLDNLRYRLVLGLFRVTLSGQHSAAERNYVRKIPVRGYIHLHANLSLTRMTTATLDAFAHNHLTLSIDNGLVFNLPKISDPTICLFWHNLVYLCRVSKSIVFSRPAYGLHECAYRLRELAASGTLTRSSIVRKIVIKHRNQEDLFVEFFAELINLLPSVTHVVVQMAHLASIRRLRELLPARVLLMNVGVSTCDSLAMTRPDWAHDNIPNVLLTCGNNHLAISTINRASMQERMPEYTIAELSPLARLEMCRATGLLLCGSTLQRWMRGLDLSDREYIRRNRAALVDMIFGANSTLSPYCAQHALTVDICNYMGEPSTLADWQSQQRMTDWISTHAAAKVEELDGDIFTPVSVLMLMSSLKAILAQLVETPLQALVVLIGKLEPLAQQLVLDMTGTLWQGIDTMELAALYTQVYTAVANVADILTPSCLILLQDQVMRDYQIESIADSRAYQTIVQQHTMTRDMSRQVLDFAANFSQQ
jgi:hypothetical protein